MEHLQLIQISIEEFERRMEAASERGAMSALAKSRAEEDRQLSTSEAMEFTGYTTHEFFRAFCKSNQIVPVAKRCRVNYYALSDLKGAGTLKNTKRK